jgi:hypothetical protein
MRIAVRDTPLMELTLRRYEKPQSMNERELVRKLCLSIGLLQPGDSRDVVVDVLHLLLASKKAKKELTSEEIDAGVVQLRKEHGLPMTGIAPSNVRRQLKRLRNLHIVQKVKTKYRINEFGLLSDIYDEKIKQFMLSNIEARVKEYFQAADARFS